MIRYIFIVCIAIFSLQAGIFQSVPNEKATLVKKGENKQFCSNCAMSLPYFFKTNHIHKNNQYCSLHCLYAVTKGKLPLHVKVVDTKSLKFIDAYKAFYVVGSKKSGTMSVQSKYAFKDKKDAQNFMQKYGGKILDFEKAYAEARDDFKLDMKMMAKKREKKIYKKGKYAYKKKCSIIDVKKFEKIDDLKLHVKRSCKSKKEKELQSILVYLWDIKKLRKPLHQIQTINVPKDAKCPICGMFVKRYPKWVSKVVMGEKEYYFDGPKDMLKFIFGFSKDKFDKIYVTDYFTGKKIDAKKANFVIGSDVYGPMGKELVAFESDEAAYNFKNDHFGKKVLVFSEITEEILIYLK